MRACLRLLFILLALLVAPSARAASDTVVAIAAAPTWVQRIEPDLSATAKQGEVHDGSFVLLSDVQRRVGATNETYIHRARKVLTPSGVTAFAQIAIDVRSSYERLTLHAVRVRRGGESIDALRKEAIKILDSEEDADALIYRGTSTVRLILDDVRVGDVIETEFTIIGANPVFEGKALGAFDLAYSYPVHHLHRRLLTPKDRSIAHRLLGTTTEPTVTTDGELTVRTWDLHNVAAIVDEDQLPPSYDPSISVQWSEFSTWKDVVAWSLPMYSAAEQPDKELSARIESIRTSSATPEAKVLAALKLVQSEIRYLGLELGASSHKPAAAATTFKRRFGDCKDKTILLVTILRALGVEAEPALVNTSARSEIERWLPSPLAFDHVIVRARVNDRTYWLDGTISSEEGSLDQRVTPPFARALLVSPSTEQLATIERKSLAQPLISVDEEYVVPDYSGSATATVRTVYRASEADDWRTRLASEPRSEIERSLLNYYAKRDLDVVQVALPTFDDDRAANTITITERYRFPSFWRGDSRHFSPYAVFEALRRPHVVRRTLPLAVTYPFKAQHVTRVVLPGPYHAQRDARALLDATFKFDVDVSATDNVVTIRTSLETLRDTVPASESEEYLKMVDRIDEYSYGVDKRAVVPAAPKSSGREMTVLLIVVATVGGFFISRGAYYRVRRWKHRRPARAGEVPARAIVVKTEAELLAHIDRLRCSCGARWSELPGERLWSEAKLEGRNLSAVRTSCTSCGEWTRCWFDRSGFPAE